MGTFSKFRYAAALKNLIYLCCLYPTGCIIGSEVTIVLKKAKRLGKWQSLVPLGQHKDGIGINFLLRIFEWIMAHEASAIYQSLVNQSWAKGLLWDQMTGTLDSMRSVIITIYIILCKTFSFAQRINLD